MVNKVRICKSSTVSISKESRRTHFSFSALIETTLFVPYIIASPFLLELITFIASFTLTLLTVFPHLISLHISPTSLPLLSPSLLTAILIHPSYHVTIIFPFLPSSSRRPPSPRPSIPSSPRYLHFLRLSSVPPSPSLTAADACLAHLPCLRERRDREGKPTPTTELTFVAPPSVA